MKHSLVGIDLRKFARDKSCQIRVPGVCNHDPATTVLCHYRLSGYCGTGMKPDDLAFGAHGCGSCHKAVDGVSPVAGFSRDELRLMHAEGVMRTIAEVLKR